MTEPTDSFNCIIDMSRLLTILVLVNLYSCKKQENDKSIISNPNPPPANATAFSWLALGDSYTIGQGVIEEERYPAQTIEALKGVGIKIDTLRYIATSGWTTRALLNAIAERKPNNHTIVSLLIGVNDQNGGVDSGTYRKNFREALGKSISLANGKKENVFVLSIPDYSVTPYIEFADTAGIRKQLDAFNIINKEETAAFGCPYIDITPSTRLARTQRDLLCFDGLHPSRIEYFKWARELTPMIEKALK